MRTRVMLSALIVLVGARAGAAPSAAVAALQAGRFEDATREAAAAIARNGGDASAHLVAAISRYKAAAHQLSADLRALMVGLERGGVNHAYGRFALDNFEKELVLVDADLAAAARDPKVSLDLCLACWKIDWNGDGRVNRGDELLFQIEQDAAGAPIPDDDPRRKPTFRFDVGDVYWARAMLAFQDALVNVVRAFRWADLDPWLAKKDETRKVMIIHLEDKKRIALARARLLDGLGYADRARQEYLAETDDEREWVPNPRQKSHPLPLPVDEQLYRTWEGVTGDLRRLVASQEGLAVSALHKLADQEGNPPRGFLDLGRMLSDPKDLVLPVDDLERLIEHPSREPEKSLRGIFGSVYVNNMKPTPLLDRLARMKSELARGEETFERKLRYLFWLN
jgi:hypothetical protein